MNESQFDRIERMLDATNFTQEQLHRSNAVEAWLLDDPEYASLYIAWLESALDDCG